MPARIMLSVTRLVTFAPSGSPEAVGATTELLIEPISTYRYSILALQLAANIASMPAPTVQPERSVFDDETAANGTPVAVNPATPRLVSTSPTPRRRLRGAGCSASQ